MDLPCKVSEKLTSIGELVKFYGGESADSKKISTLPGKVGF